MSINEITLNAQPATRCFLTKNKPIVPEWAAGLLFDYEQEKKSSGYAKSSISMIHNSCLRLLKYMERKGLKWADLTPDAIKDFIINDNHSTPQGRSAYSSRIRGFLGYLGQLNVVPDTLSLAVPVTAANRARIVKVLNQNQYNAIYTFCSEAKNPKDLRISAILMIALTMGLRSSDISSMQISDINWEDSKINFTQQKTGELIELPLTVEAGNSIRKYLLKGRPKKSLTNNVFVCHRAPYSKLHRTFFSRELNQVLADKGEDIVSGFHILRRTYATKLLINGTDPLLIATSLGHKGTDTVGLYLSTDEQGMRLCTIGLNNIEYCGVFKL